MAPFQDTYSSAKCPPATSASTFIRQCGTPVVPSVTVPSYAYVSQYPVSGYTGGRLYYQPYDANLGTYGSPTILRSLGANIIGYRLQVDEANDALLIQEIDITSINNRWLRVYNLSTLTVRAEFQTFSNTFGGIYMMRDRQEIVISSVVKVAGSQNVYVYDYDLNLLRTISTIPDSQKLVAPSSNRAETEVTFYSWEQIVFGDDEFTYYRVPVGGGSTSIVAQEILQPSISANGEPQIGRADDNENYFFIYGQVTSPEFAVWRYPYDTMDISGRAKLGIGSSSTTPGRGMAVNFFDQTVLYPVGNKVRKVGYDNTGDVEIFSIGSSVHQVLAVDLGY